MATLQTNKRYIRTRNPKPFRLQPGDIEIIRLIYEYRFITTFQIVALLPRGLRNLRRRLRYLFDAGIIDRPRAQYGFLNKPGPMVYALGNQGADVLAKLSGKPRGEIDWRAKNREVKSPHIDHALMISNFHATLDLALRTDDQIIRLIWEQGLNIKLTTSVAGRRVAIVPDAFFTLQANGLSFHQLLEADRSTMTAKRFQAKLTAYWQWFKDGGHRRDFGIPRFRVLILTISEKRMESLRKLAKNADDRKQGSALFLFGCEKNFSLDRPGAILEPMWQTPVDDQWHSIIS